MVHIVSAVILLKIHIFPVECYKARFSGYTNGQSLNFKESQKYVVRQIARIKSHVDR